MNTILATISAFILIFIALQITQKVPFMKKKEPKLIYFVGDAFFIWIMSLYTYTAVLNNTVESLDYLLYSVVNLIMLLIFLGIAAYLHSDHSVNAVRLIKRKNTDKGKTRLFMLIFYSLIVFISILLYCSSNWLISTFGPVSIEQLLYSMQNLGGTNTDQVYTFIDKPLIISTAMTCLFIKMIQLLSTYTITAKNKRRKIQKRRQKWKKLVLPGIAFSIFAGSVLLSINTVGFAQVKLYFGKSTMIETEFVDANRVTINFPEKKRNLIYIFVESLEGSYTSKSMGGTQKYNLLKELTDLTKDGAINFSNSDKFGGAYQVPGTEYTAAGIVSQTAGMPLKAPTADANAFGMDDSYSNENTSFLPGLTSIGEILKDQGYNQSFVMGSDATFGGRRTYLEQHGDYDILDLLEMRKRGVLAEDYFAWWGYEDGKLFDYAKTEALRLAGEDEPFNLTMLTADTHFPGGLLGNKPAPYDSQYANVIAFTSRQVVEFVEWCQQQSFYENTTIVVTGDHLTMDQDFVEDFPEDYERTIFNLYINSPIQPENGSDKNRAFGSFDYFPTTLASLNASIIGDRLGMGTNLFSNKSTVIERHTLEKVRSELSQRSDFYTQHILNFDETSYKPKGSYNSTSSSESTEQVSSETTDTAPTSTTSESTTETTSSEHSETTGNSADAVPNVE